MSKNVNAPAVVELVPTIVLIDGENYSVDLTAENAARFEALRINGAKTAADKDFIFKVKTLALKSAISSIKASVKAETAKRSRKTRAAVVAEVILDFPKFERGFANDTEKNEFLALVAEAGKKYSLEPNDGEALKFNFPKVRDAFEVIRSRYTFVPIPEVK